MKSISNYEVLVQYIPQNNDETTVYLKGYWETGDGGEGIFCYQESSSLSPNLGTIVRIKDDKGFWVRQCGNRFNVKWFGAKGNDTDDDVYRIQNAIDSIPQLGGINGIAATIYFPNGRYVISRPLLIINDGFATRFVTNSVSTESRELPTYDEKNDIVVYHNYRKNITLEGSNASAEGGAGCSLVWKGPAGIPMIRLHSRGCMVKNIGFSTYSPEVRCLAAIEIDNPFLLTKKAYGEESSGQINTNNNFEHIEVVGFNLKGANTTVETPTTAAPIQKIKTFDHSVLITNTKALVYRTSDYLEGYVDSDSKESVDESKIAGILVKRIKSGKLDVSNVEFLLFHKCHFKGATESNVKISSFSRQQKSLSFFKCAMGESHYGIQSNSGSYQTYSCSFTHITGTALHINNPTDSIRIQDTDIEAVWQLMYIHGPASALAGNIPITINGGRFSLILGALVKNQFMPRVPYIENRGPQMLTVQQCAFTFGLTVVKPKTGEKVLHRHYPDFKISTKISGADNFNNHMIIVGNFFPNENPIEIKEVAGITVTRVTQYQNRHISRGGSRPIDTIDYLQ